MTKRIEIFTDGACRGNPGPGGWGVLLRYNNREKEIYGSEPHTTNNRMELMAAIMGLEALNQDCDIVVVTDSNYVKQGITEWIDNWKRRNWRTAANKPVLNAELWQRLDQATRRYKHTIKWRWIKGHSGHPENERVDRLANKAIDEMLGSQ